LYIQNPQKGGQKSFDKNKVIIYKDSDIDAPDYLKQRCHPGKPSIKFIYQP